VSQQLSGKRALVTGAAKRTGRGIALALAQAGADVAVHYRSSKDAAAELVREIEGMGRRSVSVQANLVDAAETEAAFARAAEAFEGLDILVNNVGAILWKDLHDMSPEEWRESIDGTLTATYHACRAALPALRESGCGRIITLLDADADALAPVPHATPYKIGKTGSLVLTKTLAVSEAAHAVTANAVSPGTLDNSEKHPPLESIPMGRYGTVQEVADAVLFLASDEASYITGTNLKVAGGYLL